MLKIGINKIDFLIKTVENLDKIILISLITRKIFITLS
jgi:hypothetical protein